MSTLDNAGRQRKVRSGRRATKQRVQRDVVQAPPLQVPVPDRAVQHGWESASDAEIALRQFDMDPKYGPCIGLTRQQRWQRAKDFGLDPPQLILDILKSPDHNVPSHSLWEHTASGSGPVIE
ncbi:DNA polymerase delta subunit 4 [Plasmodiophora brassicae]